MKLKNLLPLIFTLLIIGNTSCKKQSTSEIIMQEERPTKSFFNNATIINTVTTGYGNGDFYELGNTISFLKPGKVTHLGCLMADLDEYVVTLWKVDKNDDTKGTILAQTYVSIKDITEFNYMPIVPIVEVNTNDKYIISIHTYTGTFNRFYTAQNNTNNIYPYTSGNIKFENRVLQIGIDPVYPGGNKFIDNQLLGVADLIFKADY